MLNPDTLLFALPVLTTAAGGMVPDESYQPLRDKRVLFTSPQPYAARLAPVLIEAGAKPTWAPSIETGPLSEELFHQLDDALLRLSDFDHVAFTSRHGIIAVASRLHTLLGIDDLATVADFLKASGARFSAIGADALLLKPLLGITVDTTTVQEASPAGLVVALRGGTASGHGLVGQSILAPVPLIDSTSFAMESGSVPEFLAGLESAGASKVLAAPAYRSRARTAENSEEYRQLSSGEVDAVFICSCAEAQGLAAGLRDSGVDPREVLGTGSSQAVLAVHGRDTAEGAYDALGISPQVVPDRFDAYESSVASLAQYFDEHQGLLVF